MKPNKSFLLAKNQHIEANRRLSAKAKRRLEKSKAENTTILSELRLDSCNFLCKVV